MAIRTKIKLGIFALVGAGAIAVSSAAISNHTSSAEARAVNQNEVSAVVSGNIVRKAAIAKDKMILFYMADWAYGNVDNVGIANNDGGVRLLVNWDAIDAQDLQKPDRKFVLAFYSRETNAAKANGSSHGSMDQEVLVQAITERVMAELAKR